MSTNRPTVLILANDPAFARDVTAHWPHGPAPHSDLPEFVVLDEGFSRGLQGGHYELAIADASSVDRNDRRKSASNHPLNRELRQALHAAGKPGILIHSDPSRDFYNIHGAIVDLRREPGIWPAVAGLVGREILRRHQAELRAREAEKACATARAEATLGRYMVEMRTNVTIPSPPYWATRNWSCTKPAFPPTCSRRPTPSGTWRSVCMKSSSAFLQSKKS